MPIQKKTVRKPTPDAQKTRKQKRVAKSRKEAQATSKNPPMPRRHPVPAPGAKSPEARRDYLAMTQLVLETVPARGRGVTQKEIFDAVAAKAEAKLFPGDTHRMWAKQVLIDLASNGTLVQVAGNSPRWRRA